MSGPFDIREIHPADVDAVVDVISEHVLDHRAENRRPVIEDAAGLNGAGGVVGESADTIIGCMIYTLHDADTAVDDLLARPVSATVTVPFAFLRYAYIRHSHMGQGYGSAMLERVVASLRDASPAEAVIVEAWHRPETLDLRPLLDKFGFQTVFSSEEYWAHEEYDQRSDPCSDCGVPIEECDCGCGVYRLDL